MPEILLSPLLPNKENVNICYDLNVDINKDKKTRPPIINKRLCFFLSGRDEPNKKKRATEANNAAMIMIDRLRAILLINYNNYFVYLTKINS